MKRFAKKLLPLPAFLLILCLFAGSVSALDRPGLFPRKNEQETTSAEDRVPGQLYADDIEEMNNGNVTMLFSEDGYLTFLKGKYYEEKVENEEDGIKSLYGIQALLGLSKGSEFFCVYGEKDPYGYTYYTYQQRYGDLTLLNAVLKIIVDPEGYTAGLVCSFTPNIGIAPEDETSITAEEAIQIVMETFPNDDLHFYPEASRQTSVTVDDVAYHAWAVFSNFPNADEFGGERRYLEHLVAYNGIYLSYMAVPTTMELVPGDEMQTVIALTWFDGKEADTYTGTVTLHDGTKEEITVPVVKDTETGLYYLADLERHILLSDYYTYLTNYEYVPFTSEDNTGWPEHYLITYANYIKVYDFYDSFGMHSVDGFGMPLLILYDYCELQEPHYPVDNACFCGFMNGWALFGASAVNDYGECVDVLGHEFTHAITNYIRQGDLYENESGALNEATSDIMGNICEMYLGETQDTQWLIAENTGKTLRSMSFPWLYKQPVKIGGEFYIETTSIPLMYNDFGGIHTNSSLVNYVAWQLWAHGLSLEDSYYLWREAMNFLTPLSGFREIHHALIFAAEVLEMDVTWIGLIHMLCEEAGY